MLISVADKFEGNHLYWKRHSVSLSFSAFLLSVVPWTLTAASSMAALAFPFISYRCRCQKSEQDELYEEQHIFHFAATRRSQSTESKHLIGKSGANMISPLI